jgi:NADPH-dependent 2,4-dienoyl-CoA reductase/sulfur reductase-like enzyme
MTDPTVIVGGDAAGMSAASKLKRDAPDQEVVVFERGEWVSYGACGLPYYVKGDVDTLEDLVSIPPSDFREERGIDLRMNHEVIDLDAASESVTVEGPDGMFDQSYGDLLLATGARAAVPPIDGTDLDGVHSLHDMADGAAIRRTLDGDRAGAGAGATGTEPQTPARPSTVGIVGGGYVGVEMAEAFDAHGVDVHLFEMLPHTLQPFGAETAAVVEDHLAAQGVELHLGTAVSELVDDGDGHVRAVATDDGAVPVDLALVGAGVTPNVALAEAAGITLGPTGAVATDAYGRTSVPNVYAAGDVAESTHVVTGEPVHVPLALTANRAGRAVGATLAGDPTLVGEVAGTAALKAFDLEVARTGLLDAARARDAGFDPVSTTITTESRAHYYPGGEEIQVTLVADRPSGQVLGASLVGPERVVERVDTVATALYVTLTTGQLARLDLAYAPPFGPVWDPILTAAKVLDGKTTAAEDAAAERP